MTATLAERPQRRRWSWPQDRRLAYSARMTEIWAQRPRKLIPGHPDKRLGHLDRGSTRTFEEPVARARDPSRKVRCNNWMRCRP